MNVAKEEKSDDDLQLFEAFTPADGGERTLSNEVLLAGSVSEYRQWNHLRDWRPPDEKGISVVEAYDTGFRGVEAIGKLVTTWGTIKQ